MFILFVDFCAHDFVDFSTSRYFKFIVKQSNDKFSLRCFPGWYGKGVYFSEYPRYSMNYIRDSSKLLLCQVLPGKVYRCRHIIQGESLRPGFDSHMSPDGKEVVVFNAHHILPSYIVHYSVIQGDFCYENNE